MRESPPWILIPDMDRIYGWIYIYTAWVGTAALMLSSCVTLGKLLNDSWPFLSV